MQKGEVEADLSSLYSESVPFDLGLIKRRVRKQLHREWGTEMDKSKLKQGMDQAWPHAISFNMGIGSAGSAEMLWRCEGTRGGRTYTSGLFASLEEAQNFAHHLQKAEPDQTFNVEQIKASTVWN